MKIHPLIVVKLSKKKKNTKLHPVSSHYFLFFFSLSLSLTVSLHSLTYSYILVYHIRTLKTLKTVPFRGPPRYNPKRRSGIGWLNANGGPGGGGSLMGTLTRNSSSACGHHGPPSPCPSEHMPYSSASSSLSEGSSGHRSHEDDISIVTGI